MKEAAPLPEHHPFRRRCGKRGREWNAASSLRARIRAMLVPLLLFVLSGEDGIRIVRVDLRNGFRQAAYGRCGHGSKFAFGAQGRPGAAVTVFSFSDSDPLREMPAANNTALSKSGKREGGAVKDVSDTYPVGRAAEAAFRPRLDNSVKRWYKKGKRNTSGIPDGEEALCSSTK